MPSISRLSNPRALGVQYDHRDTKGEVLEVLTDSEEITGQRVVERKLLNLTANAVKIITRYPFPFTHQFLNARH